MSSDICSCVTPDQHCPECDRAARDAASCTTAPRIRSQTIETSASHNHVVTVPRCICGSETVTAYRGRCICSICGRIAGIVSRRADDIYIARTTIDQAGREWSVMRAGRVIVSGLTEADAQKALIAVMR